MPRTTAALVEKLLGSNYGELPNGDLPDLDVYVQTATVVVDRAYTLALSMNPSVTLTGLAVGSGVPEGSGAPGTELELMERWLACHFYCQMDPLASSKSTDGASSSAVSGSIGSQQEAERYKKGAINIDYSGALNVILNRSTASASFAGTRCGGLPVRRGG